MISIIIPTHNRCNELNKCLESILNQTYKHFEVIVVDDGSTDSTSETCQSYSLLFDLKYIYLSTCSGGPATPRNIGIQNSKFQWIAFLDSDDVWMPNKLQLVVDHININSSTEIIFHDFHNVPCFVKPMNNERLIDLLLKNGNFIINSSVVVHKKLLFEVDLLDANPKLISAEDFDLWIRVFNITNNYFYLENALGKYSYSSDSISLNYKRKLINLSTLFIKHKSLIISNKNYFYNFFKTFMKYLLLTLIPKRNV
jgi:glycosyltransferase involved in cell wall biosynthesis